MQLPATRKTKNTHTHKKRKMKMKVLRYSYVPLLVASLPLPPSQFKPPKSTLYMPSRLPTNRTASSPPLRYKKEKRKCQKLPGTYYTPGMYRWMVHLRRVRKHKLQTQQKQHTHSRQFSSVQSNPVHPVLQPQPVRVHSRQY